MNTQHATIATLGECIAFDPARSGATDGLQNRTRIGEDMINNTTDKPALDKEELLRNIKIMGGKVGLFPPHVQKVYRDVGRMIESGVFDMKRTKKECRTCKWINPNPPDGDCRCSRYPPKRGLFDTQILPRVYPDGLCGEWCEQ